MLLKPYQGLVRPLRTLGRLFVEPLGPRALRVPIIRLGGWGDYISNHGVKNSGNNLAFFEVSGKALGYFGQLLADFWGYFPLLYAMLRYFSSFSRYFALFYFISRYFTLISDSMISFLRGALRSPNPLKRWALAAPSGTFLLVLQLAFIWPCGPHMALGALYGLGGFIWPYKAP